MALRDVSFEIHRGETVGIVGRNGSGKSTLLQLICGIIPPTSGTVEVHGRIAAILELGAGFNPEFSGRENVRLGASVMGLGERQILDAMDDIIAFSELADFIDQPVKTYSSGMYIRLAFALAISADPDILIIDEALAVGDEAFQRKCFARIEQLKAAGCTLLFVSHSAGSVTHLCDRAILFDQGKRFLSGSPRSVIAHYQRFIYAGGTRRQEVLEEIRRADVSPVEPDWQSDPLSGDVTPSVNPVDVQSSERFDAEMVATSTVRYVSRGARILSPRVVNAQGEQVNVLIPKHEYRIVYSVEFDEDARFINFGMMLKSLEGVELFGMTSNSIGDAVPFIAAGSVFAGEFRFRFLFLPGTFSVKPIQPFPPSNSLLLLEPGNLPPTLRCPSLIAQWRQALAPFHPRRMHF